MNLKLILTLESGEARTFSLQEGVNTIGRDKNSSIQIVSEDVSRSHAQIACSGDSCVIEDLKSSNGTVVNGKKVSQAKLAAGDEIGISDFVLRVVAEEESKSPSSSFVPRVLSERSLYATVKAKAAPSASIKKLVGTFKSAAPGTGKLKRILNRIFRKS